MNLAGTARYAVRLVSRAQDARGQKINTFPAADAENRFTFGYAAPSPELAAVLHSSSARAVNFESAAFSS